MDPSSVVTGLLGELAKLALNAALNKVSELKNVRPQVMAWRPELELIQAKLNDVESKDKSETGEVWRNQLMGVANSMHNVIQTFQNIEEDKSRGSMKSKLKFWKRPLQLNDLSAEIESITQKLMKLKEYSPQLVIVVNTEDPAPLPTNYEPSYVEDPKAVGLHSDKRHIIRQLLDDTISTRTVLSIVGVGGLGKTTLAQKVYNSSELDQRFQRRTWLTISETFNENNILRELLYSIEPAMKSINPPLEDKELVTEVKSCLRDKRYLIILDDVWTKDLWDGLEKAVPDANNGSRVIITTRDVGVARAADRNTEPHQLPFLTDDESVALLFRTALQRPDIQPEDYPPPLKDVAQKLIKKCGGLPLALVVLGGILKMEDDTFPAWNRVYETMDWHDEDGEKCMKILEKSYDALPNDHLKQCFLYFAPFPEDYHISAKHITRMWMADELIPKPRAGILEDQAERYLQELVKRCLVQVTEKAWNGNCKYCRMHDLVRELAVQKAKEENFFTIFSKEGDVGNLEVPPNRVAVQYDGPIDDDHVDYTNTRSLLCFRGNMSGFKALEQLRGFKHLRVLFFEQVHMQKEDISSYKNWLEGLVYLRYLGFRKCDSLPDKLLGSISLPKSLETLDCFGTQISATDPSLWKIPTLRHVITHHWSKLDCPLNWDQFKNLQTLKWVRVVGIPTVECDLNLRTLKIAVEDDETPAEEGRQRVQALLSRMKHLVSLAVISDLIWVVGKPGSPSHEQIQSLSLCGSWAKTVGVRVVEIFPKNLTKLKLELSKIKIDPILILKRLQSLRILHLSQFSYVGAKMSWSAGGFPSLHKLRLFNLPNLSEWEIEEGAMPVLSHLEIDYCKKLHTLPELQNVPSLQELVVKAPRHLCERWKTNEDRHKIEHIPVVRIAWS